ncbi:ribonuclease D, partial [Streptomyces sp. S6]
AWADKDPAAAARLSAARARIAAVAERLNMPQENLITPDTVRRVCWEPPAAADAEGVAEVLVALGARAWQVELVTPVLVEALGVEPA